MEILKKILTWFVLPVCIAFLAYLCYQSVMKPVNFNKEKAAREQVAIQRLKDIRTLQSAFKSANLHYASTIDSLKAFYNDGKIEVIMQIGSSDDSLAMANTRILKMRNPRITADQMYELYLKGERLVFSVKGSVPVKDTLCKRPDFCIDSIAFIPCCGDSVMMATTVNMVSGVKVPLFEAKMPYGIKDEKGVIKPYLLKGLDHQLLVNLYYEREDTDRYPGLMVGSVTTPNNNAGNWE